MTEAAPSTSEPYKSPPPVQRWSAVLWPSFVFAGITISVFFSAVDPKALLDCSGTQPIDRTTAYSLGFLICWLLYSACSAATAYLLSSRVPPPKRIDTESDDELDT